MSNKFRIAGIGIFAVLSITAYGVWKFILLFYEASFMLKVCMSLGLLVAMYSPFLHYFLNMAFLTLPKLFRQRINAGGEPSKFLKEHVYTGRVSPADLDMFFHMNNGRYPNAVDFARTAFYFDSAMNQFFVKHSVYLLLTSQTTRFRRSLELFQKYFIKTKVVYWDSEAFYIQHTFLSQYKDIKDFVFCIVLTKMNTINTTPENWLKNILKVENPPERPQPSKEIELFIEYNKTSSQTLRQKPAQD